MNNSLRRMLIGGIFFLVTVVVAVAGYMAAGWHFLDAVYMVVITVFGVGYGETKPLDSPTLKIFTMGVIIAGCSSGIYVVGGFVSMLAEGEINRVLGSRRMSRGIEQLTGHILLCGYGRVGQMIAHDLAKAGRPFVVIDNNEGRVAEAHAAGYLAVFGSASDDQTLLKAGIARAKTLATVLPDDTANVFITLTARDLNGSLEIIARAENPATERKLLRSGANRIVLPALIGATKIANMITRPTAEDMLSEIEGMSQLNDDLKSIGLQLTDIAVLANSALVGVTAGELETGSGFVLVGIKRPDGVFLRRAPDNEKILAGDTLIVLGHGETLPQLMKRAKPKVTGFRGATT
jgi:voltage-gated potassium channel